MVNMVSPWVDFYRQIEAMFNDDPEITVKYDNDEEKIKIYVDGSNSKITALSKILPEEKVFGNVTIKIEIIPSNVSFKSDIELIQAAFKGNPNLVSAQTIGTVFGDINYVVFKNQVVQYYNDDMGDINGQKSTLYQDIAKNIFDDKLQLHYCTDKPKSFEW